MEQQVWIPRLRDQQDLSYRSSSIRISGDQTSRLNFQTRMLTKWSASRNGGTPSGHVLLWVGMFGDVRLAVRRLRKDRLLAATAVVALALGIGASTAVFSL